jgi:hypothetical protein
MIDSFENVKYFKIDDKFASERKKNQTYCAYFERIAKFNAPEIRFMKAQKEKKKDIQTERERNREIESERKTCDLMTFPSFLIFLVIPYDVFILREIIFSLFVCQSLGNLRRFKMLEGCYAKDAIKKASQYRK